MLVLNFHPFPTIITPGLLLRQLKDDDVTELFALRTDERVNRYLNRPMPGSLDEVKQFIAIIHQITQKNEGLYWVITRKNEPKLLGTISLRNFEPDQYRAEIGFELQPNQQGQGLMQEALTHVLEFAFNSLGLRAIIAETDPENLRSIRILERHGFVKFGHPENYYSLIRM